MSLVARAHRSITEIAEGDWDALLGDPDEATPFMRWAFLEALEHAGCAVPRAGWTPRHLSLTRGGKLVAVAPAYVKNDSDADFSRDFGFAEVAYRHRIRYYPKLAVTVPITPVTGRRVLIAAGEDRREVLGAFVAAVRTLAEDEKLGTVQVLFPREDEALELEEAGMARRIASLQGHWVNRGYTSYADWLASLDSKHRYQARKEREHPARQGIEIRTIRGEELAADTTGWGDVVGRLYTSTIDKLMWGRPWLNPRFFARIFARMPGPLEVVAAFRDGKVVAGAFNAATRTHLFGRYWGCFEEHPFLHFNVCLYHSVDDCISRGIKVFEGGAGGEHKLHRGFDLRPTWSSHLFLHPGLDDALRDYLDSELEARQEQVMEHGDRRRK